MVVTSSHSSRIRQALSIATLLTIDLVIPGCVRLPPGQETPPLNASALSGGKIKNFIPVPGLEHDPTNPMLLTAAGLSGINGSVAHSGFITFQSSSGNNLVSCLVIGSNILVVVEDFTRQAFGWEQFSAGPGSPIIVQGPPYNGKPFLQTKKGQVFLYDDSQHYIQITPNDKTALVGGKPIQLSHAVLWQDGKHPLRGDHVIFLADLLRLLQERDKQMGSGTSIRNVKIIYDLRDYHR